MCLLAKKQWLNVFTILVLGRYVMSVPPPVQNFTTITLYTDTMTWENARRFCSSSGGKLLDPTYYSMYNTLFIHASLSPWKDLPIANAPQAWTALHRRITPVGDDYYSDSCEALTEFNVIRWDSDFGPPDGPADAMCVLHGIVIDATYTFNDYTNTNCSEKHRFYCQNEQGPCEFEELVGYGGYSANDGTSNDIILALDTVESCKERCLNESYVRPSTGPNTYTEECWGFTTTYTQCIIHIVLQPRHFDSYKSYYGNRNLYIKRCFATAVNNTVLNVTLTHETSDQPNSTCGMPILVNSSILSQEVILYNGSWTWNEAFQTCSAFGAYLLDLTTNEVNVAFRQFLNEGNNISETLWLGLHEPDPQSYPDVRVWSTCEEGGNFTWDPSAAPSTDRLDTSLCAVINTTSLFWLTVPCNERHQFLCIGNLDNNWSFSSGTENAIGTETTLGPYNVAMDICQSQCNSWTYKEMECQAFAYMKTSDEQFCRLYFAEIALTADSDSIVVSENYTFYRKLSWNVSYKSVVDVADDSFIPHSCCDPSQVNVTTSCPADTVPIYETQLPTTEATSFVLFTSPVGWNVAQSTCRAHGGDLVQPDGISKRHALRHYINNWIQDGLITGLVWQGIVTTNSSDTCSAKWARDCSTPDWLPIHSNDGGGPHYCATVDRDVNVTFVNCNQSLSFVCELSAGRCEMNEIYSDTACLAGQNGVIATAYLSTCEQTCLTFIYQGKECWAMKPISKFYCQVMFYVDPMYCKNNNQFERNADVTFKNCYKASVNNDELFTTTDDEGKVSPEPNSTCYAFTFPYMTEISNCGQHTVKNIPATSDSSNSLITSSTSVEPPVTTMQESTSDSPVPVTSATSTFHLVTTSTAETSDSITPFTSTTSVEPQVTTQPETTSDSSAQITSVTSTVHPGTTTTAEASDSITPITSTTSVEPTVTTKPETTSDSSAQITSVTSTVHPGTTTTAETSYSITPITSTTSVELQVTTQPETTSDSSAQISSVTSTIYPGTTTTAETSDSITPITSTTSVEPQVTTQPETTSDSSAQISSVTSTIHPGTTTTAETSYSITPITSTTSVEPQVTTQPETTSDSSAQITSVTSTTHPGTTTPAEASDSITAITSTASFESQVTTQPETTSDSSAQITSVTSTIHPGTTTPAEASDSITAITSTASVESQVTTQPETTSESSAQITSVSSTIHPGTTTPAEASDSITPITSTASVESQVTTQPETTSDSSAQITSVTSTIHPGTTTPAEASDSITAITSTTSVEPPVTTLQDTASGSSDPSAMSTFHQMTTSPSDTSDSLTTTTSSTSAEPSVTTMPETTSDSSNPVSSATSTVHPLTTSSDAATTLAQTSNDKTISSDLVPTSFQSFTSDVSTFVPTTLTFRSTNNVKAANNSTRIYIWPCLCNPYNHSSNFTTEQWAEWMQTVNIIKLKTTSRYRRTLTSAEDNRVSAVSVGSSAAGFMVVVASVILLSDVLTLVWKGRLKSNDS